MEQKFYSLLTNVGKAKIANAAAFGNKINLTKFIVGDGGGEYYEITETQKSLKNRVWEGKINSLKQVENNPNWIELECIIPADVGGFMIRELGVIDDKENLIVICKYPETYKPLLSNGCAKELRCKIIIEISNSTSSVLQIDSTVLLATQEDIETLTEKININKTNTDKKLKKLDSQYQEIDDQLKKDSTKTITKEANIIDLQNNIPGTVNIVLKGNTIDICKEPIISDFKGKTINNTLVNPNIMKYEVSSSLISPTQGKEVNMDYKYISELGGTKSTITHSNKDIIPQQLFSFDIVSIVERKIGKIQKDTRKERAEWIKKNIKTIKCNWYGYGTCPSGNKAYGAYYRVNESKWSNTPQITTANDVKKISDATIPAYTPNYIDNEGFVHYLTYTDPSDGKTPSAIYTDYVNIEIQLNPILKSVGEEREVQIKSIGKNLFNGVYENKYTDGGYPYCIQKSNETRTAFIRIQPGKTYYIKKYSKSNRLILGLYNSIDINSIPLLPLKDLGDDTMEGSITNNVNAKYLSVYVSNNNEIPILQVEEGTTATQHEDYKEDKIIYSLKEPLRGINDNIRDIINVDGTITRRVGKSILCGDEEWKNDNGGASGLDINTVQFYTKLKGSPILKSDTIYSFLNDKFEQKYTYNYDIEGSFISASGFFWIRISKTKLSTPDITGLKKWLSENNITVFYKLAEPIIETAGQPLTLQSFVNGTLQFCTEITPFTTAKYPSNVNSRISSVEEATEKIRENLGGAWNVLLRLADSDLELNTKKLAEFGGRNYFYNSVISSLAHWSKRFQKDVTNEQNKIEIKEGICHIINTNQDLIGIYQKPIEMDLGSDYTLSFDVKCSKKVKMLIGFSMTGVTIEIEPTNDKWVRIKRQVGKPIRETNDAILYAYEGSEIYLRNAKIEKGLVATDFSLAIEETIECNKKVAELESKLIAKGILTK